MYLLLKGLNHRACSLQDSAPSGKLPMSEGIVRIVSKSKKKISKKFKNSYLFN